jgi:hypothetical protein
MSRNVTLWGLKCSDDSFTSDAHTSLDKTATWHCFIFFPVYVITHNLGQNIPNNCLSLLFYLQIQSLLLFVFVDNLCHLAACHEVSSMCSEGHVKLLETFLQCSLVIYLVCWKTIPTSLGLGSLHEIMRNITSNSNLNKGIHWCLCQNIHW